MDRDELRIKVRPPHRLDRATTVGNGRSDDVVEQLGGCRAQRASELHKRHQVHVTVAPLDAGDERSIKAGSSREALLRQICTKALGANTLYEIGEHFRAHVSVTLGTVGPVGHPLMLACSRSNAHGLYAPDYNHVMRDVVMIALLLALTLGPVAAVLLVVTGGEWQREPTLRNALAFYLVLALTLAVAWLSFGALWDARDGWGTNDPGVGPPGGS